MIPKNVSWLARPQELRMPPPPLFRRHLNSCLIENKHSARRQNSSSPVLNCTTNCFRDSFFGGANLKRLNQRRRKWSLLLGTTNVCLWWFSLWPTRDQVLHTSSGPGPWTSSGSVQLDPTATKTSWCWTDVESSACSEKTDRVRHQSATSAESSSTRGPGTLWGTSQCWSSSSKIKMPN